ncbi:MAG TPA: trypsin-like serine protease [Polyangia bacterium]|nr:trypsin-like serine protease [Polyangia bacterium]
MIIAKLSGRSRILGPAIAALLLPACGGQDENDVVDQGETSAPTSALKNGFIVDGSASWRGVVFLEVKKVGGVTWVPCTAVVTSKKTMVTAAHCVTYALGTNPSGTVLARAKRETAGSGFQTIMPESFVAAKYNPAYDGTASHDVAVITGNAPFLNITQSEAMPIAKGSPSGVTMYTLGYGNFDNGPNYFDGQGRSGQLTVTYAAGTAEYTSSATASQPWLCHGDSGGPLKMVSGVWMVFGIASQFEGTGTCGNRGHWAATANNWSWIQSTIQLANCSETNSAIFCW